MHGFRGVVKQLVAEEEPLCLKLPTGPVSWDNLDSLNPKFLRFVTREVHKGINLSTVSSKPPYFVLVIKFAEQNLYEGCPNKSWTFLITHDQELFVG